MMRDELGLEPGASLQELQQVVLSRSPVTLAENGPLLYTASGG